MGRAMNDLLQFGKSVLESQPFSKLLGAELTVLEEGRAEITLVVREQFKQQHGFVHGGVISYLADNCLTYAGGSVLGNSVTSEFKINYLRPAIGDRLIARATVMSAGKSQAVCDCNIMISGEKVEQVVAVALGTIKKVEV